MSVIRIVLVLFVVFIAVAGAQPSSSSASSRTSVGSSSISSSSAKLVDASSSTSFARLSSSSDGVISSLVPGSSSSSSSSTASARSSTLSSSSVASISSSSTGGSGSSSIRSSRSNSISSSSGNTGSSIIISSSSSSSSSSGFTESVGQFRIQAYNSTNCTQVKAELDYSITGACTFVPFYGLGVKVECYNNNEKSYVAKFYSGSDCSIAHSPLVATIQGNTTAKCLSDGLLNVPGYGSFIVECRATIPNSATNSANNVLYAQFIAIVATLYFQF